MKRLRRRKGATLGFVAVVVLVIAILGIGFFVITKFLGGGREMANATDAGVLNVAKNSMRHPQKDALSFSNPDVGTNFALLGENPRNLNLLNYNRLVAQSMIVALNAKDEGTVAAATNAKRLWIALNDVGRFLRSNHESPSVMGSYFLDLAGANSLKMLGNNPISLNGYGVSFMRRGQSTNVAISPVLLSTFAAPPAIPTNNDGAASRDGEKYMAGYMPLSVTLSTGETLPFSGVTVLPHDRPHLVNLSDFSSNSNDRFMTSIGLPGGTLPANAFQSAGQTKEKQTQGWAGATACAIASSMNMEYRWQIPYGYIVIKNGPPVTPPTALAASANDIFSHSLAKPGIVVNDDGYFSRNFRGVIRGQPGDPTLAVPSDWDTKNYDDKVAYMSPLMNNLFSAASHDNLIDQWFYINRACRILQAFFGPVVWDIARTLDLPPMGSTMENVRTPTGARPTRDELQSIYKLSSHTCEWECYTTGMCDQVCLDKLNDFRTGYNEWGSTKTKIAPNEGFNAVEYLKADIMAKRVNCTNSAIVEKPPDSGVKLFVHGNSYPAPKGPYNFGVSATPHEYLQMIDSVPKGEACGLTTSFSVLLKRCQQISSKITAPQLERALRSHKLPLGASMYLFVLNDELVMQPDPPPWMVANTTADGTTPVSGCGSSYMASYTLVNTSTGPGKSGSGSSADEFPPVDNDENVDGEFPGYPWKSMPSIKCVDQAIWTPSSGFNNFLGEFAFKNSCQNGGTFSQPN